MILFAHVLIFSLAIALMWIFSGILVGATDRVAKHYHQSGFTVSFFVLGFLTSIPTLAVMVDSLIEGTPAVAFGNVIGAPFVILLFIIPFLAILGGGVTLRERLSKSELLLALVVVILPTLFAIDGHIRFIEGVIALFFYGALFYFLQRKVSWWSFLKRREPESAVAIAQDVEKELVGSKHPARSDLLRMLLGAIVIFFAGILLVRETVFFANILGISSSFMGLIVLSIGTSIPELIIAVRSVIEEHMDIAFGDYLGSAVSNTLYFGILTVVSGSFELYLNGFLLTSFFLILGLLSFYLFANSKNTISRKEGGILICIYGFFLLFQILSAVIH